MVTCLSPQGTSVRKFGGEETVIKPPEARLGGLLAQLKGIFI